MLITDHPVLEELRKELSAIEQQTLQYSLADAIREGSGVTDKKENGYYNGYEACTLAAARLAVEARGLI